MIWEVQTEEPIRVTKNGGKIHEAMRGWGWGDKQFYAG